MYVLNMLKTEYGKISEKKYMYVLGLKEEHSMNLKKKSRKMSHCSPKEPMMDWGVKDAFSSTYIKSNSKFKEI